MKIKKILLGVLLVLAMVVVTAVFFMNHLITAGIRSVGPRVTGTPVMVDDVQISLLSGTGEITGLVIGNPEDFKSDYLMQLDRIYVSLVPLSIFSDTIHIKEIRVEGPSIAYETSLGGSNLKTLLDQMGGDSEAKESSEETEDESDGSKQVIIDQFLFMDGSIKVTSKLLQGKGLTLNLPDIHKEGIGQESSDAGVRQVFQELLRLVITEAFNIINKSGELVGKGVKTVADTTKNLGEGAVDTASDAVKGLTGMLKKKES